VSSPKPKVLGACKRGLYRKLIKAAEEMRKNPTPAEVFLWVHLKNKKTGNKFRRQHVLFRFIVDFYCIETGLIVEVDGGIHDENTESDIERDCILESLGCKVLRFRNEDVLSNIESVKRRINEEQCSLRNNHESNPSPLGEGCPKGGARHVARLKQSML
jgi:very-short-patch-repair endonuclease